MFRDGEALTNRRGGDDDKDVPRERQGRVET